MSRRARYGIAASVLAAVVAVLAFGVFGVHTLFIDEEADEGIPVFTGSAPSGLASDTMSDDEVDAMNEFMAEERTPAKVEMAETMPEQMDEPAIVRLVEGTFVDRSHPAEGTAVVLNDGSMQRFLRLESDFATDNGPDLNVYLSAGVTADSDAGLFDDDFVDLGDLKGNIGSQNYEIPPDVDLDVYRTVVIWCVRFGVAFGAADLG